MQSCVGNYQTIANTNAAANNPAICENNGRCNFYSRNEQTSFGQDVPYGLLRLFPLLNFTLVRFPPLQKFCSHRIFHSRIFSRPANTNDYTGRIREQRDCELPLCAMEMRTDCPHSPPMCRKCKYYRRLIRLRPVVPSE